MLFCRHFFSSLNTFMRKGKDPKQELDPEAQKHANPADPDPQQCLVLYSGSGHKRVPVTGRYPYLNKI
jgi:hypothetical protein